MRLQSVISLCEGLFHHMHPTDRRKSWAIQLRLHGYLTQGYVSKRENQKYDSAKAIEELWCLDCLS
jgi:hypothetical protein